MSELIHSILRRGLPLLAGCVAVFPLRADQGWEGHILHINWENDATRGSDRHYTQGARLSYLSSDDASPQWLRNLSALLPTPGFRSEALKFSFEVGQEIYTPEDLSAPGVIRDDQPYAGWFYGAFGLVRRGPGPADIPVMEHIRLDLGVIGPESKAEQTQKVWHGQDPRGWDNQLDTEPGLVLRYERSYLFRFQCVCPWGIDFIPAGNAALGNVDTHLGLGTLLRAGYNIPNSFEVPVGPTAKRWGFFLFGGGGGKFVGHNIFLDGNTWRSSHNVDKYYFTADASVGLAVVLKGVEIAASHHYRTRQFHEQHHADSYGSATVTIKF